MMKTSQLITISAIALILMCLSPKLTANANAVTNTADPCKTQANTIEINECAKSELAKKDKALNVAYQMLIKKLAPSDKLDDVNYTEVKKQLLEAQQNWIKYRDADCKAKYTLNEKGTIRGVVHLGCLIERTEQRTKELLNWNPE